MDSGHWVRKEIAEGLFGLHCEMKWVCCDNIDMEGPYTRVVNLGDERFGEDEYCELVYMVGDEEVPHYWMGNGVEIQHALVILGWEVKVRQFKGSVHVTVKRGDKRYDEKMRGVLNGVGLCLEKIAYKIVQDKKYSPA